MVTSFKEYVAIDVKFYKGKIILHLVATQQGCQLHVF